MARGRGRIELKCDARLPDPATDEAMAEGDEYIIVIDKPEGSRLGVDLASQDGEPWRVKSITGGLVERWNSANPTLKVLPGDRIIEANGVRSNAAKVREECSKIGSLRLVLQRGRIDAPTFHISFGVGPSGAPGASGAAASAPQGAPPLRGPVLHSFSEQSCCGLRRAEEEFDLLSAVDRSIKKVSIHVQVLPAPTA